VEEIFLKILLYLEYSIATLEHLIVNFSSFLKAVKMEMTITNC